MFLNRLIMDIYIILYKNSNLHKIIYLYHIFIKIFTKSGLERYNQIDESFKDINKTINYR